MIRFQNFQLTEKLGFAKAMGQTQSLSKKQTLTRLGSGLRIDDKAAISTEGKAKLQELIKNANQTTNNTSANAGQSKSVEELNSMTNESITKKDHFAAEMLSRLLKAEATKTSDSSKKTEEEAQLMVDSLLSAINELEDQFGSRTAATTMNLILDETKGMVSFAGIFNAFAKSLDTIAESSAIAIARSNPNSAAYKKAQEADSKLESILGFLNAGSDTNENGKEVKSLSNALNDYFKDGKLEGGHFEWLRKNVEDKDPKNTETNKPSLTLDDIGREELQEFINFLRNDLNNEDEAQYFENLAGTADFMQEIEKLSARIGNDIEIKSYVNNNIINVLDANINNDKSASKRLFVYCSYSSFDTESASKVDIKI